MRHVLSCVVLGAFLAIGAAHGQGAADPPSRRQRCRLSCLDDFGSVMDYCKRQRERSRCEDEARIAYRACSDQ